MIIKIHLSDFANYFQKEIIKQPGTISDQVQITLDIRFRRKNHFCQQAIRTHNPSSQNFTTTAIQELIDDESTTVKTVDTGLLRSLTRSSSFSWNTNSKLLIIVNENEKCGAMKITFRLQSTTIVCESEPLIFPLEIVILLHFLYEKFFLLKLRILYTQFSVSRSLGIPLSVYVRLLQRYTKRFSIA